MNRSISVQIYSEFLKVDNKLKLTFFLMLIILLFL